MDVVRRSEQHEPDEHFPERLAVHLPQPEPLLGPRIIGVGSAESRGRRRTGRSPRGSPGSRTTSTPSSSKTGARPSRTRARHRLGGSQPLPRASRHRTRLDPVLGRAPSTAGMAWRRAVHPARGRGAGVPSAPPLWALGREGLAVAAGGESAGTTKERVVSGLEARGVRRAATPRAVGAAGGFIAHVLSGGGFLGEPQPTATASTSIRAGILMSWKIRGTRQHGWAGTPSFVTPQHYNRFCKHPPTLLELSMRIRLAALVGVFLMPVSVTIGDRASRSASGEQRTCYSWSSQLDLHHTDPAILGRLAGAGLRSLPYSVSSTGP